MKALIFSDSHGNYSVMRRIIMSSRDADCVIFAGDGISDIEDLQIEFPQKMFFCVRGNNDYGISPLGYSRDDELVFSLEGKKILLLHGHNYGVREGLLPIIARARREKADILIFGHTHNPYEKYISEDSPLYLFNPGSIGCYSYGGYSFGVLIIDGDNILLSHGSAKA